MLNQRTGRPLLDSMTLLMTHDGYDASRREITSFVPRAMTIAVVAAGILFSSTLSD